MSLIACRSGRRTTRPGRKLGARGVPPVLPLGDRDGHPPSLRPRRVVLHALAFALAFISAQAPSHDLGGVEFNSASREIRIPCTVNMNEGVIEYALVTETGKTHESLLKTKAKPFDLNVALLLCHYEPHAGELIKMLSQPTPDLVALA